MAHHAELLRPCLEAAGAKRVAEVGAYAGDLTRLLVAWAAEHRASVLGIDAEPQDGFVELDREHTELELIRRTSLEALPSIPLPDAVVIDGDHNHYTVSE